MMRCETKHRSRSSKNCPPELVASSAYAGGAEQRLWAVSRPARSGGPTAATQSPGINGDGLRAGGVRVGQRRAAAPSTGVRARLR